MYRRRTDPPSDAAGLSNYVRTELDAVSQAESDARDTQQYVVLHAAPKRPRQGMVAYADGTDWNPGSGEGLYEYKSGGWTAFGGGGGTGDVVGPASAVNNHVVFFDGATGKLIKDSGLTLSGSNTGDQDLSSYLTSAAAAATYQVILVSGTNIKTINGTSVLGSGDITVSAGSSTDFLQVQVFS